MEIERKWLLRRMPTVKPDSECWMEQFYISFEPEIRLRRISLKNDPNSTSSHIMTLKGQGDLSRIETEAAVSKEFYLTALDLVNCEPIQKNYVAYMVGAHKVEVINIVLSKESFVYAEVEFETEEEAKNYNFPWPELVEREVTYDPNYKMKNIWKQRNS